ncbi:2-hydroxyhepta-2,4-diene-1,7-dioate isomerase [Paraburkholderia fungorum]|jgi:2-keto-4-pentenoate hydratase/2-oxohepta-3-ene-1,7-dioic acid hydratase in catechol pathway|uniref:2-hydroxyhepta-2,4-diene-1,7-dioate isomerase n=1 Tax=Paraburkholderia fungorum TaxID=134537 RepID=A0AAP5V0E6_9BURK|nr:fumarylacetoacetate hydrolase family protein [Paraburkholderia fungorum]AJZ56838.1 2-hydroxyhepta-2,4-diene-1,7-dioate isomerase [Paraburkholderia fungorum]MBB4519884.1 2-keto-4-pentenoate hydratase/2-oxohepta-3-ene-1,7-dioic acid hydratase in catechol pathway [Paraburkholderia fungorum]MDT8843239.1 fumarylacetoacetate hydrolase family protein [Paraburkholderia fungorum]
MKICRYNEGLPGLILGDAIYPLADALAMTGATRSGASMAEVIDALANHPAAQDAMAIAQRGEPLALSSVRLLAPIDNPPAIWAGAANYRSHQSEMTERVGAYDRSQFSADDLMAEVFLKPSSAIVGPGGTVILPMIAKHVDFECELCAVIGRSAKDVSAQEALDYVYGYTMCWDISVRDPWGRQHNTRNIRKGFDTFCGVGPWFVTRDEIAEPQDLHIEVEQNGSTVMRAHTADMINGVRELIRFLSSVTTLKPGTLITTGTPAGVSQLVDGDRLKGTIGGIGSMELDVAAQGRSIG